MGFMIFLKLMGGKILTFLRGLPWQAWAALGILVAGLLYGHHQFNAGQADTQVKFDAYKAQVVEATRKAHDAAVKAEQLQGIAFTAIAEQNRKDVENAKHKGDLVIAGLQSGALRMRHQWTCPTSVPNTPAGAALADAEAALRATDTGNLDRIGATADAQVEALQAILDAERKPPHN
jgi:hypothetical protein